MVLQGMLPLMVQIGVDEESDAAAAVVVDGDDGDMMVGVRYCLVLIVDIQIVD